MNILAISGSLRTNSSNTAVVRTLASLAASMPQNVNCTLYQGLGHLPHYNPELDGESPPEPVKDLRAQLKMADGVILCTPEYAFGMPGVLKNALDWVVSSGEFYEKPTVAISVSPSYTGGEKALASLLLTLGAMGAKIVEGGALTLSVILKKMNAQGEIEDAETLETLRRTVQALSTAYGDRQHILALP